MPQIVTTSMTGSCCCTGSGSGGGSCGSGCHSCTDGQLPGTIPVCVEWTDFCDGGAFHQAGTLLFPGTATRINRGNGCLSEYRGHVTAALLDFGPGQGVRGLATFTFSAFCLGPTIIDGASVNAWCLYGLVYIYCDATGNYFHLGCLYEGAEDPYALNLDFISEACDPFCVVFRDTRFNSITVTLGDCVTDCSGPNWSGSGSGGSLMSGSGSGGSGCVECSDAGGYCFYVDGNACLDDGIRTLNFISNGIFGTSTPPMATLFACGLNSGGQAQMLVVGNGTCSSVVIYTSTDFTCAGGGTFTPDLLGVTLGYPDIVVYPGSSCGPSAPICDCSVTGDMSVTITGGPAGFNSFDGTHTMTLTGSCVWTGTYTHGLRTYNLSLIESGGTWIFEVEWSGNVARWESSDLCATWTQTVDDYSAPGTIVMARA